MIDLNRRLSDARDNHFCNLHIIWKCWQKHRMCHRRCASSDMLKAAQAHSKSASHHTTTHSYSYTAIPAANLCRPINFAWNMHCCAMLCWAVLHSTTNLRLKSLNSTNRSLWSSCCWLSWHTRLHSTVLCTCIANVSLIIILQFNVQRFENDIYEFCVPLQCRQNTIPK